MRNKLRVWLLRFLGIDPLNMISVDASFTGQTCIVVATRLNGGRVKIIETRFTNYAELDAVIGSLCRSYGVRRHDVIGDYPMGFRK